MISLKALMIFLTLGGLYIDIKFPHLHERSRRELFIAWLWFSFCIGLLLVCERTELTIFETVLYVGSTVIGIMILMELSQRSHHRYTLRMKEMRDLYILEQSEGRHFHDVERMAQAAGVTALSMFLLLRLGR